MALRDDIRTRRELVKRLVLAELLARPGRGPLALRSAAAFPAAPPQRPSSEIAAAPPGGTPEEGER